jgi:hypothetical protein
MGRPVKRDINGVLVFGDYTSTAVGIRVVAFFGASVRDDVFIEKQKGSRRYKVVDKSDSTFAVCKLVNKAAPTANGEMVMTGRVAADANDATNKRTIAKLNKRIATDYNGVRYKWSLADDSSSDDILLVTL